MSFKVGIPVLRSLEDGHVSHGPWLMDRAAVDAYKDYMAAVRRPVWKIEAILWATFREPPSAFTLIADIVEPPVTPSKSRYLMLRGR